MDEIKQLQQAILTLEEQRSVLGDSVVEAALIPIREKLAVLQFSAAADQSSLREQRKLVTVLFADVAGFTALSEKMDPEDMRDIIQAYFTRWTLCIERYGGSIEKFIGDAVLAVFGLRIAREDDPQNAVNAALAMRAELESLNRDIEQNYRFRLSMRVGIHTGPVVISLLGERKNQDFVVVGDTVNLASRLQSAAPAGGILVSQDTVRHLGDGFAMEPLNPIQVKGKSVPIQVYLAQSAKPRSFWTVSPSFEGIETRTIGRDKELKSLQKDYFALIETNRPQMVTILGEAGVGKSRLLSEFDRWVGQRTEKISHFKGRASPSTQNLPYFLMRDLLAYRFQILDSDLPERVLEKLENGLADAGLDSLAVTLRPNSKEEWARRAHFIARLLGFIVNRKPYLEAMGEDTRQLQSRALLYLTDYFKSMAAHNPVVLWIENIHWGDDSSLDALQHLIETLSHMQQPMPILLISTSRSSLYERRPGWGEEMDFHHRIDLHPLSKENSRRMVDEILQKVESIPDSLRELVTRSAEGNPFYIEELIKIFIEDGVIQKGEQQWQLQLDRLAQLRIPPTLIELLQARLDSLMPAERVILQKAAVIGRIFWDQAVAKLGDEMDLPAEDEPAGEQKQESSDLSLSDLWDLFDALQKHEMIYRRGQSAFVGTAEYLFKHALLRDVSYESMLKRLRRIYHARAARWLKEITENSQRSDEYAGLIAEHYELAIEREQAAAWYKTAGERAAAQFANLDAVRFYSKSLDLTEESDVIGRCELLLAREKLYDLQGDRQAEEQDLSALEELVGVGSVAPGVPDEIPLRPLWQARVAVRWSHYHFSVGDYPAAGAAAEKAVGMARAAGSQELEVEAHWQWGVAYLFQSEYLLAVSELQLALSQARSARLARLEASSLTSLGHVAKAQSNFAQARKYYEQALLLFRQLGDKRGEGSALGGLGTAATSLGNSRAAIDYYDQALQIYRETGNRRMESLALCNLGEAYLFNDDYPTAYKHLEQALQLSQEVKDRYGSGHALITLGDWGLRIGEYNLSEGYYQLALRTFQETGNRLDESAVLGCLARLNNQKGNLTAARDFAHRSFQAAVDLDARSEQASALMILAHTQLESGDYPEAAESFQEALEIHTSQGEEKFAIEAQAGLAKARLAAGDLAGARNLIQLVLEKLGIILPASTGPSSGSPLSGLRDPFQVCLICYKVLKEDQNPQSQDFLEWTYHTLIAQGAGLTNPDMRQQFFENVPSHREIIRIFKYHGD